MDQPSEVWGRARRALDGLPDGRGLNIAHEAVDRHLGTDREHRVAIRWLGVRGAREDLTYGDLAERTSRFANVLQDLGVGAGDPVFALSGRTPLLYVAALGTLKHRAVFSPLFAAFGPEPVRTRLRIGRGRVLVTTEAQYRRKVAGLRGDLPDLEHVLLVDVAADAAPEGTRSLPALLDAARSTYEIGPTDPEDPALLHFTSGTTGTPKGAVHVHEAVVAHHATGRLALDLRDGDVFWCTADPGWVTGTSYGIISPLTHGATLVVDEGEFEAERWYGILRDQAVDVWYTAPTAVRMLMRAGADLAPREDLGRLRFVASVGEPLHAEAVAWGRDALGTPIHDNWWQTETGGIMVANGPGQQIRPGSMGRPLPGVDAAVLALDDHGELRRDGAGELVRCDPDETGELALRAGWPSMFRGYLDQDERYARCFADGWYRSGDLVRQDADGYVWFVGRGDDVIKSAGHLIGPFEVEKVLLEHPAVVEAGVIGVPDPVAGEVVQAFVSLAEGRHPSDELRRELLGHARGRLGPAVAPRTIGFDQDLPKTRSGKIMRRLLRARVLGLDEGDTSTLEVAR
ncbi:acetate--CoA ligase [Acidimicrobiia bacterium EGI L10123]|uniref:acetate--CoA ligase n=1 Tax=Salinilacustrithrix flava TaxID=2957203 RepID=UPI003D7C342A|nr:acetate--CoA ligase [Acidimicrobiia bacterium EGI L10123]